MRKRRSRFIPLSLATAGMLFSACEKEKPTPSSPTSPGNNSENAAPQAVSELSAENVPSASRPRADGLISVTSEELHVGGFTQNEVLSPMHPSEYCLEDGKLWRGAQYRVGHINVFGVDRQLANVSGTGLVAVFGEKKESLDGRVSEVGPCPTPYDPIHVQMRSDWAPPEGGPNTTHARLREQPYIEGNRVEPVQMSEILEGTEQNARLRVRNPFTEKLSGLTVEAHYEGGSGKPMPTMVEQVLALAPGQWTELTLPRTLGGEQPRTKSGSGLHGLRIRGTLHKAEVDIEIFIPHR